MKKVIAFDMDGTITDLYGVQNWCEKINSYDKSPYEVAEPMYDFEILNDMLEELKNRGWEIHIITWLSMTGTKGYNKEVTQAKKEWLKRHNFNCDKVHCLKYGTTKANAIRKADYAILIDDNAKVRKGWSKGITIDARKNVIDELNKIFF